MPRKRKTRATEAPEEPEVVPQTEPEAEPEPEQRQPDETMEVEGQGAGDEAVKEEEEEEEEEEPEEERDGNEEQPDNVQMNENEAIADQASDEQATEITEKPSDVSENGEGQKEEKEEEDDLEEEPLEKLLEPFSKDQLTLLIKEAVAKHPDVIESVNRLADADPSHCKIFVHGLGWEASAETITSAFAQYGEIEDCKVVKDKISGKSKGYGFILFKHRHGARRALKQPQKVIDGRLTSCQLAAAGAVPGPAAVSGPPASEYTQRKIYVSNVSAELDPNKLLEFFTKFGEIEEGPLGLDKHTGKPRGFCLFVYKNLESARKALEEPHKTFEGQTLHCQRAVDGPKHSKGNVSQQFGQPYKQQHNQQQHNQGHHQGYYGHPSKKGKYGGASGVGHTGGHLMAPSGGPGVPAAGFNQVVAPEAIGQAVAALLATQGAGLGIGNLLGGIGAGVNPQGAPPPMMNNAGYGGQAGAGGYGGQPGFQGGYGGQQHMGQGGYRPHQGGAPYMGQGH
ncbi:UBP1-associated protein 2A [Striga hermonthica]|uniref:UBP1-associated protein 2A n=1 Tax=Striga hermonthica TaxID=68872 RepID=A0A9N7MB58_STRHE|nr:UBP1-associated protein 2A [Striga hermonthica]